MKKKFIKIKNYALRSVALVFLLMVSCQSDDNTNDNEGHANVPLDETFVVTGAPSEFTKKLLLTHFTGTWCGACTWTDKAVTKALDDNEKVIGVSVHGGKSNEPMRIPESDQLNYEYGIQAYSTVKINGKSGEWSRINNYPESQLQPFLQESAKLGLAIETCANDSNEMCFNVKVGFAEAVSNVKLVVFLIEDELYYDQRNFYPALGSDPILQYRHNKVLRRSLTAVMGDKIPEDKLGVGGVYSRRMKIPFKDTNIVNTNKALIVAYVVDSQDKVLNVQKVQLGSSKGFD